jgi:hypothetical protein
MDDTAGLVQSLYERPGAWNNFFEFERVTKQIGSDNNGAPKFEELDIIQVHRLRDSGTPEIIPADPVAYMRAHPECIYKVKPAYEAWKNNQSQPVTGYPLREVSVLPKTACLQFEHFGIRNVEQLLEAPDQLLAKVIDGRKYQAAVKRFMEAGEKRAEAMKLLKEKEELQNQLKAAMAEIKKVSDKFEEYKKQKGD